MKKSLIVPFCLLFVAIVVVLVYKLFIDYSINLELKEYEIKANLYDTIDINSYISKVVDNKGKSLKDKVKISVEKDDVDELNDSILYIKGVGPKVINYSIQIRNKLVVKKLIIKVVTDPNDADFKPNYERIDSESTLNNDDVPTEGGSTDLTEEQLNYLKMF